MRAEFYELGRYFVTSESGEEPYLCDVLPGGGCDCPRYRIHVAGMGTETTCKHLRVALERWRADFSPEIRQAIVNSQKKKSKAFEPE